MPAPKGNQFAIGNSGREKKFSTPELLQAAFDKYFSECDNHTEKVLTKDGFLVDVPDPIPYTIEGLCVVLDCDRDTLLNYQKAEGYEEFFGTVKSAKMKVQKKKVERALSGKANATYSIFDMVNNTDYKNTSNTDITSGGNPIKDEPIRRIIFVKNSEKHNGQ